MQYTFRKRKGKFTNMNVFTLLSARTSMVHKEATDRWERGCICGMHLVLMSLYVSTPSQERSSSYSVYLDYFFLFFWFGFYCLFKKTYLHNL